MTASMEKGVSRAMELASARQIAAQSPPLEARPHPWLRNAAITAAGGAVFASLASIIDQSAWAGTDRRGWRRDGSRRGGTGLSRENA